jgi:anthranilate synthase component I
MNFKVTTTSKKRLADTVTPVGIFLKLRSQFKNTVMLESADYHGKEHGYSHIACDPVASIIIDNDIVTQTFPDGTKESFPLEKRKDAVQALMNFAKRFEWSRETDDAPMANGMFGHICYDAVEYFEDIEIQDKNENTKIPSIVYYVYRYVIAINHFKDEMSIYEHQYVAPPAPRGGATDPKLESKSDEKAPPLGAGGASFELLDFLLELPHYSTKPFKLTSEEVTNYTDDEMRVIINECIKHCLRGDVFQIVPSRRFSRIFEGDDFQIYRALRSVNPSPYMFYFDYENYHIFGASPEKQIGIKGNLAEIHPIAGTIRRTGEDEKDAELARELLADPKESAEHVMLVDLARNDLSRSSDVVKVETFKEVQFYSHVIHLVSKVTGQMTAGTNPLQLVADTFPAGTLSGSPKHNAMSIINRLENVNRHIYGGAIGYMDFVGNFNHAIAIRTFMSKNNTLFYQAGMGVVAKSVVETEMAEIKLKLGALRKALEVAVGI